MVRKIIVQAGGTGSRLKGLTQNKPKGLLPVDNLPLIFHLFKKYQDKQFIIIADYKIEVLKKYLQVFCEVDYFVIEAKGKGTASGIKKSLALLEDEEPFILIWSDLILSESFALPDIGQDNLLGIAGSFECRWSYIDGKLREIPTSAHGVAGLFVFKNKQELIGIPDEGEFVRWLADKRYKFKELSLSDSIEVGTILAYDQYRKDKKRCRAFNKLEIENNKIRKIPLDEQGLRLAKFETSWYKYVIKSENPIAIPKILSTNPLEMELIAGDNPFRLNLDNLKKEEVIAKVVKSIQDLHKISNPIKSDIFSCEDAYFYKTIHRINKIRDMVPFIESKEIKVNGVLCRNIIYYQEDLHNALKKFYPDHFLFIHGDPTFSNIILTFSNHDPVFIDPRGYFGNTKLLGDADYDWAKLYYSITGNYDQFNNKNFKLSICGNEIVLKIGSSGWENTERILFESIPNCNKKKIELIHAVIWLSLTTYAWEDYDSICSAYYNGLYYLEKYFGG